ncbi:hypothetical protein BY458DRAFT_515540 [Sporodiniella umbellata]|nr:hypothetical protein BY458DRAFT_515540 [Sporodiniella umbellata]
MEDRLNIVASSLLESAHKDYDIKPYLESTAQWNNDDKAYLKRYFTLYYKDDVYVRQSPNKICVLGLRQPVATIKTISFKKELIGEKVKKDTVLCEYVNDHDITFQIKANMDGKLLELHQELENDIELLITRPLDLGFIAVIMPKHEDSSVQLAGYEVQS